MRVSLVVPAFNEVKGLPLVIAEYLEWVDEIIVVDDGSNDGTYEVAKRFAGEKVKIFRHDINRGKVAALRTGVKHASGDVIVFTDADYTYPARYVPELVREIEKGADLVLGARLQNRTNIPAFNRLGNNIFSFLATYISCMNIQDSQTGMRAFKREMFEKLDVNAKGLEFETKMTVRAAKLGYKIIEIPIEYRPRVGRSKLNPIKDGARMMVALISVAYTETSLLSKMILVPSLIFILIGLYTGSVSIYEKLYSGVIYHEFYPLLTAFLILVGVQLISLGLIVDYLTKKLDRIEERLVK
ncbi:glycosyltransferase family 2 protein [Methanothrix thermoacetophila]|uniref:Glycosyl transferase, family 2 n=1 Tax=Methanothrix thermoacetophila (strain DSM 6194 / JCM 14653 / NBRC 101360 / PT) TaxID=349307 RepID=A0B836_METTP|nr:glycosyltransferase family 2 protein [Methanothrix thermoacetophila]ABK14860.1 glycosyl transferase, family 2 [Methanothrix thermoacetophila PT]